MIKKISLWVAVALTVLTVASLISISGPTPVSAMTCNSATLNGTVDAGTPPAHARFTYATNYNTVSSGAGTATPIQTFNSTGSYPIEQYIDGLSPSTTYYFRLEVTNNYGTSYGSILNFTTPACTPPPPPPPPQSNTLPDGWLDGASCSNIWGWSIDFDSVSTPVKVEFYKDGPRGSGGYVTSIYSNLYRQDINDNFGISGNHAFNLDTPSAFKDTSYHNVYVYGVDVQTGERFLLNNSPREIPPCQTPPPPQVCQDPSALNYGGPLPCRYSPPPPQTCQDPSALNFGGPLPCVYPQPVHVSISANPSSVSFNGSSTIAWSSTNATSCSASGGSSGWGGNKATSGNFFAGNLTNTVTFYITCSNSSGSASDSVMVSVGGQILNPTVTISANPTSVSFNGSSTVTWNSSNATSCNASGGTNGWSGAKSLSGSFFAGNLTNSVTFFITCSNSSGSANDQTTINVNPAFSPTVTISADPSSVSFGGSTTVTWNSNNATSCSASGGVGGWSGSKTLSGIFATSGLFSTVTFNITCSNSSGSASDSVTVNVESQVGNPNVTISADDTSLNSDDSTTVRWQSSNADTCHASGGTNGWSGTRNLSGSFSTGRLTDTETYTITCSNSRGSDSDSVTVFVDEGSSSDVPDVNIRADDTSIDSGDETTLRWTSDNADSCRGTDGGEDDDWSGSLSRSGTFDTISLEEDTTYRIICTNENGSADDSVTIRVDDNSNEPDVQTRSATNVRESSATLNGRVDGNGSSVRAWFEYGTNQNMNQETSHNSYGSSSTTFSKNISGLSSNTTYYFRAVAENSQDTVFGDTFTFNTSGGFVPPPVNNQPTVVLAADSTNLPYNGATFIRWSTFNATSCSASGGSIGWAGDKSIGPGSFYTGSLTSSKTFTMTCFNGSGSATDSVTVGVRGQVLGASTVAPNSLVLITSSIDRNQPIIPTLSNTNPCPGDEINYNLVYQNVGSASVHSLTLQVILPQEVEYISSNPNNPNLFGNTLVFTLGTLRAGAQGSVTVHVRVRNNVLPGVPLNFPAILSYVNPNGSSQSVTANVSGNVCGIVNTSLGAGAFLSGIFSGNIFGWLLLIILILLVILLAKRLLESYPRRTTTTTIQH